MLLLDNAICDRYDRFLGITFVNLLSPQIAAFPESEFPMPNATANKTRKPLCFWAVCFFILFFNRSHVANAYTPEDPVVRAMIQSGVKALTEKWHSYEELGGDCLCAMALYKCGVTLDHPRIQAAIKTARAGISHKFEENYSPTLACIFLSEVDPQNSRQQIQAYLRLILTRRGSYGTWNYSTQDDIGDTSQSQYGVLSLWYAKNRKFAVPPDAAEKALKW